MYTMRALSKSEGKSGGGPAPPEPPPADMVMPYPPDPAPAMAETIEAGPPFASQGISFRYDALAEMEKGSTSGRRKAWSGPRPITSICFAERPATPRARSNSGSPGRTTFLLRSGLWNSSGMNAEPAARTAKWPRARHAPPLATCTRRAPPLNPARLPESRVFLSAPKRAQRAFAVVIDAIFEGVSREVTTPCVCPCVRCAADSVAPGEGRESREIRCSRKHLHGSVFPCFLRRSGNFVGPQTKCA